MAHVPQVLRLTLAQDGLNGHKRRVRLIGPTTDVLDIGSARNSPILRIGQPCGDLDQASWDEWVQKCSIVGLVFHLLPAIAANLIEGKYKNELASGTLVAGITLGRASIFLASDNEATVRQVITELEALPGKGFRGWEEWCLESSYLKETKPHIAPVTPIAMSVDRSAAPNGDFRTSIEDATLSLNTILSHSQVYTAGEMEKFEGGKIAIHRFLENARLLVKEAPADKGDKLRALQGKVTEFAASLSYVDSQWYAGTSRIVAHPGQVRDQSLLGVGIACSALSNALYKANLITDDAKINSRFTSLLKSKAFDANNALLWSDWAQKNNKETYVPHVVALQPSDPVVHFSARRGWRESEFSLSAPVSALRHGLSRSWHVRNISHEWLHSHVRGLLDLLKKHVNLRIEEGLYFQKSKSNTIEKIDKPFLLPPLREADVKILNVKGEDALDGGIVIWCILCTIAYRCEVMKTFLDRGLLAHNDLVTIQLQTAEEFTVPGAYQRALQMATEELDEIAVQILDLMYFYEGNEWEYLEGIWPAWSNIPIVHRRCGYYMRRLFAAMLSTKKTPNLHDADALRSKLLEYFDSPHHQPTDLTDKAKHLLLSPKWGEEERPKLAERLRWITAVRAFFHFDAFSSRSLDDRFLERRVSGTSSKSVYTLAPFQYSDKGIQNPFVMLSHMQRTMDDDSLAASMWLFSQLASAEIRSNTLEEDAIS